jgi:hypothetical protein
VFLKGGTDAAVIFSKQDHCTLCWAFPIFWYLDSSLGGSYPEFAVEIPDEVFHQQDFQSELVKSLLCSYNRSGNGITYTKLLNNILRGMGRSTEIPRVTECIRSRASARYGSWRCSSLWLLIKAVIQTSLNHGGLGRVHYKAFMLHYLCSLAKDSIDANLSSDLLRAISAKILRRLRKLGASGPHWLYDMVLKTNTSPREILEARWKEVQAHRPLPPLWKPSQLDFDGDTQLSLLGSLQYIRDSLANLDSKPLGSPFSPKHLPRGTLNDFLSSNGSFFEEAYRANSYVTLYDVEQAVEQGIDEWLACLADVDVDEACIQLGILIEKYLSSSQHTYQNNPEHISIMLLTVIELWVALDKLVVAAIPMLADYSPEIPAELLHRPLLRKTMNFHHLRGAYQYLSARHSQFVPGNSIFSDEFTIKMFPVRYCVNSPHFRHYVEEYGRTIPSHIDVAVFELRCPISLHVWRSTTDRLLGSSPYFPCTESYNWAGYRRVSVPLANISRLQPFLVKKWTSPDSGRVYLTCLAPSCLGPWAIFHDDASRAYPAAPDEQFVYWHTSSRRLNRYANATSHTSNGVLAAQGECPDDLPPLNSLPSDTCGVVVHCNGSTFCRSYAIEP